MYRSQSTESGAIALREGRLLKFCRQYLNIGTIFVIVALMALIGVVVWKPFQKESPARQTIECSINWRLPSNWNQAGSISLEETGEKSSPTRNLIISDGGIGSPDPMLVMSIKKKKDGSIVFQNTGRNMVAITFHNPDAEVCQAILSPSQQISSGRQLKGAVKLGVYVVPQ